MAEWAPYRPEVIAWGAHWAERLMAQLAVFQHGLRMLFSARNARMREKCTGLEVEPGQGDGGTWVRGCSFLCVRHPRPVPTPRAVTAWLTTTVSTHTC